MLTKKKIINPKITFTTNSIRHKHRQTYRQTDREKR